MKGGTTFHLVTEGVQNALEQAFAAADGQDVRLVQAAWSKCGRAPAGASSTSVRTTPSAVSASSSSSKMWAFAS
jgi:hypothetical protein